LTEEIKFSSQKELSDKSREIFFEKNILPEIVPLKVTITKPIDLFKSKLDMNIWVSERLKNKIEESGLTGFDFERSEVKTEFYEDF